MRVMTIASGSSGNCVYVGSESTHILIDAGISRSRIIDGLNHLGLTLCDISAVFFTHEHADHVRGAGVIARKSKGDLKYIGTEATLREMKKRKQGMIPDEIFSPFEDMSPVKLGDLEIRPFKISHDAADPVAYTVSYKGDKQKKIGIATDLGTFDDETVRELEGSDFLLVEANHDINMLQAGPYPYELKRRVMGDKGHLSNEASGQLIGRILNGNIERILLGHMSKENNYEALACETVRQEIDKSETSYKSCDIDIKVAPRNVFSNIYEI